MMEYVGVHIVFESKQKPTRRRRRVKHIEQNNEKKIRIYYLKPNIPRVMRILYSYDM